MLTLPLYPTDRLTRRRVLARMRDYLDNGYRDPELLYAGARLALYLGFDSDARRFLDAADGFFTQSEGQTLPRAYAPYGLLRLAVAQTEEEAQHVRKKLKEDLKIDPPDLELWAGKNTVNQRDEAGSLYEAGELAQARAVLEAELLADGNQTHVLRNLITVAAEQRNIEGYERYWRRYVSLVLWRMICSDDLMNGWQELTAFYLRVADATDRDMSGAPADVTLRLKRPGFLPRWLEAHVALVWLESALKSRPALQTGMSTNLLGRGHTGNLGLMRYWFRLFYPQFEPFVFTDLPMLPAANPPNTALPSPEGRTQLEPDPTLTLLTRFVEWRRFNFGLTTREVTDPQTGKKTHELIHDRHAEAVTALANCVAQLPIHRYLRPLAAALREQNGPVIDEQSIRRILQEACTVPFTRFYLDDFLKKDDWAGLRASLDRPGPADGLSPTIRLILCLAYGRTDQPFQGLRRAYEVLPELTIEDFAEGTQTRQFWLNLVQAAVAAVLAGKYEPSDPLLGLTAFRGELEHHMTAIHVMLGEGSVTDGPLGLAQKVALNVVDEAQEGLKLRQLIEKTLEKSKKSVGAGQFEEARRTIRTLPDKPDDVRKLKTQLLEQITEVEQQQQRTSQVVEQTVARVKQRIDKGDFNGARREVETAFGVAPEWSTVKADILKQIAEVEQQQQRTKQLIDQTVARVKTKIEAGDYAGARREVETAFGVAAEWSAVKTDILKQIAEVEQQQQRNKQLVDQTVTRVKQKLDRNDFNGARREVENSFGNKSEWAAVKAEILRQISEVERARRGRR